MREKASALRSRGKNSGEKELETSPSDAHAVDTTGESSSGLAGESTEPMALVDKAGRVRHSNFAAANLLGHPAAALKGRSIFESVHPRDTGRAHAFFEDVLAKPGVPVIGDFRFRRPGGGYRSLGMVALNRLDAPGLESVILTYHDITDREQAAETRARLAAIVESSDDAIIAETLDGIVTSWNQAAERLYGWTREEAIGHPISMTVPADRMEELTGYMARVRRGDRVDHLETVRLRKDGSRLDVSITLSPIFDEHQRIIGLSKSSRDITERRRFEAELWKKNIELEIANRAKDAFLASMSHELRTPLNSIIGFTGTMLMKLPGNLTEDQERQLQLIQFSARHLLSLINDLLNLAKVQSGKAELWIERVACRSVVQELAATLRPSAEAKGLRLEVGLPSREVEIQADRRTLLQILLNLAGNAIKFTDRGTVRVELEQVKPEPGKRREVAFRVIDTGVGIRREDQGRLFQAFEQFHPQRSPSDPGSGLGLHLSQRMANLLGGRIDVSSEQGKGSEFTLRLPEE